MPYTLITGGSTGIGKAIAECLAEKKYSLLLVARSGEVLKQEALRLQKKYDVEVHYLSQDLSLPGAARQVYEWVTNNAWPVQILVNNAGYGMWGDVDERPLEKQLNMMQLNMIALFELTYFFIPLLKQQTPAYILNVGSMAGLQAMPSVNGYAASKGFVNMFSRALYHELKQHGVHVTLLCPGSVDTRFIKVAGMQHMEEKARKNSMTAEKVARAAVKAMFKHRIQVIPGFSNLLMAYGVKHLPKYWVEKIAQRLYELETGIKP